MIHLDFSKQKFIKALITKCSQEKAFKQELISNPVETIEKLTGKKLNLKGFKLAIIDKSDPSTIYLTIPANKKNEDLELTEEQLEFVAGGASYTPFDDLPIDIFF